MSRQDPIPWVCETLGIAVTSRNLVIVTLIVVLVTALHLTLTRTMLDRRIRVTADNTDLARVSGVRIGKVIFAMWPTGGAFTAAGGVFLGLEELVCLRMDFDILFITFATVILDGIGFVCGVMLGGLVIGMVHEFVLLFYQRGIIPVRPRYAAAVVSTIIAAILLTRSNGVVDDNG